MVERGQVYNIVNAGLFCILLVVYYVLYMEKAVENYMKKSTTIVERQEDIIEMKSPVFVLCPDPPFKTSFFRHNLSKLILTKSTFLSKILPLQIFENYLGVPNKDLNSGLLEHQSDGCGHLESGTNFDMAQIICTIDTISS